MVLRVRELQHAQWSSAVAGSQTAYKRTAVNVMQAWMRATDLLQWQVCKVQTSLIGLIAM
jgi:hypothetical protein